MNTPIYTIGHSTHTQEHFIELLRRHGITVVADVRSTPYSKAAPQFNTDALKALLNAAGIAYVFLGKELGARRAEASCYVNGKVDFGLVRGMPLFLQGIERLKKGLETHRIALLCVEKDPLGCHRTMLISRHLVENGIPVSHILADGSVLSHQQLLDQLLKSCDLDTPDFFLSPEARAKEAYARQSSRVAYEIAETEGEYEI
jgi:uncharacterized protein (DUF488 family)